MKFIRLVILIILSLAAVESHTGLKFKQIKVQDGLSQSWVKCIYQDSYGYLWFGTAEGVNKYNGCDFRLYKNDPGDNKTLSNNLVNVIFEDSSGNLWVGTQSGINIYDRVKDHFNRYPELQEEYINDFIELNDGRIIVAYNAGMSVLYPSGDSVNTADGLDSLVNRFPMVSASDLLQDKKGNIWIASYYGVYLLDLSNRKLTLFELDKKNSQSIYSNSVHTLYQDREGRIWIGTFNRGLFLMKYNPGISNVPEFIRYKHDPRDDTSISNGAVYSILGDGEGNLWIGTENGGLNLLEINNFKENQCRFIHYRNNPSDNTSISSNSIYSIYEDKEKTIWIGTYGGGLSYYNETFNKFLYFHHIPEDQNSISNNCINVIYEEREYLWIGTELGLNVLNKKTGKIEHYFHDPADETSLSSNSVLAICRDKRDNMWIGTWAGGLNLFNEKTKKFKRFVYDETDDGSLGSNNIFDIMCDSDGDLWIATMGGGLDLYNYKTQQFKRYTTDFQEANKISDNWVEYLLESSTGEIWISTTTAVDIFDKDKQKFTTFRHDTSDPHSINYNGAIVLYEDSNNNIWAGTESGLNLFNREDSTFSYYQESDGLPNNTIKGICEDDEGNLWLSTNFGLSKFINGINHPQKAKFKNYNISDGLQGNEFNNRSVCKGQDGMLYFGGNNGFNAFKPEDIEQNLEFPKVILTNFLIFNKPVEIGGKDSPLQKHISLCNELCLSYNHSVFSIEYAALNFLKPDRNNYAFMLEGFDNNWNYVGNQRLATYTNLDAGEYIFKVKASNNEGIWNDAATTLKIIIVPPWWETSWAYFLYFIIAFTILYTIWRFQLNKARIKHELILEQQHAEKLQELNRMKSRFFSNITHEFRTPLTLIMGPVKQFLSEGVQDNFKDKCRMIIRNSEKLYQLINQLLELNKLEAGYIRLKARKVNIIPRLEKIILTFSALMDAENIKFQFIVIRDPSQHDEALNIYIDPDKFDKIISNLLTNAIKFTPENGRIELILKEYRNHEIDNILSDYQDGSIEIIVKDTGKGIPEENLQKIFDRFYQVDTYSTSGIVGTGIGLSLVKELVELHHGNIKAESVTGQGTTFTVRLFLGSDHLKPEEIVIPLEKQTPDKNLVISKYLRSQEEQLPSRSETNINVISKNGSHILIVEDNIDVLKYLNDSLNNKYHIIKARNGREGIKKAVKHIPDLIVSDIMMPNMDGYEFCRQIKGDERTSHIPIIFLTARASKESKIKGLKTGADDYIGKPFEIKELEARIQNLIEQRQRLKAKFNRKAGLRPEEITESSLDKKFLEKALAIIEENISDPEFGVERFAREMALSRVQLYRKVRALTGQTASEFIRTVRINRAAQLLKQKTDNIGQIAFFVGFNSPSYFSKCFYKQFGIYPSNYTG